MKRRLSEVIENSLTKIIKRDNVGKAKQWLNGDLVTPYQSLVKLISNQKKPQGKGCILHWFRSDLRVHDNRSLQRASAMAQKLRKPLITLYVVSMKEWERHSVSDIKIDLILRTLKKLQLELPVPLIIESVDGVDFVGKLEKVCKDYDVGYVFANYEYEIDELRRDKKVVETLKVPVEFVHDACIVDPELIKSKTGNAFKMFKPWFNDWLKLVFGEDKFLELAHSPVKNELKVDIADNVKIDHHLDETRLHRMLELYLDDENAILQKCQKFIKQDLQDYEELKDIPSLSKSSLLSPYINIGSISTRTIINEVLKKSDKKDSSVMAFIREVAWRDFYRHKIVEFPHVVMNLPFNLKTVDMFWENDPTKFEKWCTGHTGYPMIDLSMRQLNSDGYMNNRCRMICGTFLLKNLLVDWRYGESYFMSKLIDGDFASNNGGWGFVSSTGINCQPFFRVFNPDLQQQKFDPDFEFVKKWVPEYESIEPIVDYKSSKDKYIESFRDSM